MHGKLGFYVVPCYSLVKYIHGRIRNLSSGLTIYLLEPHLETIWKRWVHSSPSSVYHVLTRMCAICHILVICCNHGIIFANHDLPEDIQSWTDLKFWAPHFKRHSCSESGFNAYIIWNQLGLKSFPSVWDSRTQTIIIKFIVSIGYVQQIAVYSHFRVVPILIILNNITYSFIIIILLHILWRQS